MIEEKPFVKHPNLFSGFIIGLFILSIFANSAWATSINLTCTASNFTITPPATPTATYQNNDPGNTMNIYSTAAINGLSVYLNGALAFNEIAGAAGVLVLPYRNTTNYSYTSAPSLFVQCVRRANSNPFMFLPSINNTNGNSMLPISEYSFVAMFVLALIAFIFLEQGDTKRSIIFVACAVLALLSIFSMLLPTWYINEYPQINQSSSAGNSNIHAFNVTVVQNTLTNSEITLYSAFMILLAVVFVVFAFDSFKNAARYRYELVKKEKQADWPHFRRNR